MRKPTLYQSIKAKRRTQAMVIGVTWYTLETWAQVKATLKAIAAGGPAAVQMRALFNHLKQKGKLSGQYGMENLDEFVAEAFSNPQFQQALDKLLAPAGSGLKSAWQAFVRVVARLLGLTTARGETALSEAMRIGARLMRENAALNVESSGDSVYSQAPKSVTTET